MSRMLVLACATVLGLGAAPASALTETEKAELLAARWRTTFKEVLTKRRLTLVDASGAAVGPDAAAVGIKGAPEVVRAAYEEAIERLLSDPELHPFFRVDPAMIDEPSERSDQEWVARLAAAVPREKGAKATNATLTNPAAPQGAERSGFADLLSLALDSQNFVATDKSAVTVNLNAFALIGLSDPAKSAQSLYRDHGALRRVGGSFTFGAKIPEKEITGVSGLPSSETLLDTVGWDVKCRVYGDRDPRAVKWYGLMVGYMGGIVEVSANLLALVPSGDRDTVKAVLNDVVGASLKATKARLENSAQVTLKAGGQHLTKEQGKNKYTFALLADKGFGNTDLTANVSYAVVDDVTIVPGSVATLKTWSGAIGLKHLVGRNLLASGRAIELSLDARVDLPVEKDQLPVERKNVWRAVGAVSVPWGDGASIPVSITYGSDPNNLTKEKFVSGHIGISYDFGALKSLFQTKDAVP
jgi:hypothetical protein